MKTIRYIPKTAQPNHNIQEVIRNSGFEPIGNGFAVVIEHDDGSGVTLHIGVEGTHWYSLTTTCPACGITLSRLVRENPTITEDDVLDLYHDLLKHRENCYAYRKRNGERARTKLLENLAYRIAQQSDNDLAVLVFYLAEAVRELTDVIEGYYNSEWRG